mgnify:CR=1 FL=1|jgi:hypothetical protein
MVVGYTPREQYYCCLFRADRRIMQSDWSPQLADICRSALRLNHRCGVQISICRALITGYLYPGNPTMVPVAHVWHEEISRDAATSDEWQTIQAVFHAANEVAEVI